MNARTLLTISCLLGSALYCSLPSPTTLGPSGTLLIRTVASSEDAFAFCEDGTARVEYRISELNPHVRFGTWKMDGMSIKILWHTEKGGEPEGDPVFCGSVCTYRSYEPFERSIQQTETVDWSEIELNEFDHWQSQPLKGHCSSMPG
jgi:hypothetical protein